MITSVIVPMGHGNTTREREKKKKHISEREK
jgi:hypothetical protein